MSLGVSPCLQNMNMLTATQVFAILMLIMLLIIFVCHLYNQKFHFEKCGELFN